MCDMGGRGEGKNSQKSRDVLCERPLIIIALYFTYRIGIFDMMKNCLPTKFCLLCIKTKVEAPTHVVTYNAAVKPLLTNDVPKN